MIINQLNKTTDFQANKINLKNNNGPKIKNRGKRKINSGHLNEFEPVNSV